CRRIAQSLSYHLSLHDALPICSFFGENRRNCLATLGGGGSGRDEDNVRTAGRLGLDDVNQLLFGVAWADGRFNWVRQPQDLDQRSEEHTSELQSRVDLVCRLLL